MISYNKKILDLIRVEGLFKLDKNGKHVLGKHGSKLKRENIVSKLSDLPGTKEMPQSHLIYKSKTSEYEIFAEKPGKEADREKNPNMNDMRIYIKYNSLEISDLGKSFTDILKSFEDNKMHLNALNLIAYLLIRNAFCFDHDESNLYSPSKIIIEEINKEIDTIHGLPFDVFLHFLDTIASNEDVKYSLMGKSMGGGTGRRNNLLTYVNFISVLQGKKQIYDICGNFASGNAGVAPLTTNFLYKNFPLLRG